MEFSADIVAKIDADFGVENRLSIQEQLQSLQEPMGVKSSRLSRCVLFLADGDRALFSHNLRCAKSDWRDAIYWAECDRHGNPVRDFNLPFP